MDYRIPFILISTLVLNVTIALSDEPLFLETLKAYSDRSGFFGTRITYEFAYTDGPMPDLFEGHAEVIAPGKRILEIGLPIEGSVAVPNRISHIRRIASEPLTTSEDVTTYWEAFDGRETHRFLRTLFFDKCAYRSQHLGGRLIGCDMEMRRNDPLVMAIFFSSRTLYRIRLGHEHCQIVGSCV
jgi:hypothetical protein